MKINTVQEYIFSNIHDIDLSIRTHKINNNHFYETTIANDPESEYNKKGNDVDEEILRNSLHIPFKPFPNPHFTFIDLFAGVGGFRLALQNLKGKCLFSSEWDVNAKKTYYLNFGEIPFGDITKENIKNYIPQNFDILCAGFPCQPFSIAGNQKGFGDTRGTLFFEIEEIIKKNRPKVVFLENVKNLVSHDKGNTFKTIINTLESKLNYKTYFKVINTATHADIPQNRERIFIVAFDNQSVENSDDFSFPDPIPLTKKINNFINYDIQKDVFYYKEKDSIYSNLKSEVVSSKTVYQWRRIYVRENKNNLCPTLTANMGTGGHNVPIIKDNYGIRKLTPKECFAFQGYPINNFKLPNISNSKLYMQAGNSVTTTLVERIANQIVKVLLGRLQ